MTYANIVHNNSPNNGIICVEESDSIKMLNCIFENNHDILFCVKQGSLEVSHAFIDHSESIFSGSTAISTTNNSMTKRITYQIQFFNSHHCYTDLPLILKTLENTMEETMSRTYDSECEIRILSSDGVLKKRENYFIPVFISFVIV